MVKMKNKNYNKFKKKKFFFLFFKRHLILHL
jgi:hypothetical protein